MVAHKNLYLQHVSHIPSGARYLVFLERVSQLRGMNVTPATMRTNADVDNFVQSLTAGSIKNYRTVLKHYTKMVAINNL